MKYLVCLLSFLAFLNIDSFAQHKGESHTIGTMNISGEPKPKREKDPDMRAGGDNTKSGTSTRTAEVRVDKGVQIVSESITAQVIAILNAYNGDGSILGHLLSPSVWGLKGELLNQFDRLEYDARKEGRKADAKFIEGLRQSYVNRTKTKYTFNAPPPPYSNPLFPPVARVYAPMLFTSEAQDAMLTVPGFVYKSKGHVVTVIVYFYDMKGKLLQTNSSTKAKPQNARTFYKINVKNNAESISKAISLDEATKDIKWVNKDLPWTIKMRAIVYFNGHQIGISPYTAMKLTPTETEEPRELIPREGE